MKWRPFFLFAVLCSTGCAEEQIPEGILDREKFAQVLVEAQLIESRVNYETVLEHREGIPTGAYYEEMLMEQGVSEEEFTTTFEYYSSQPKEFREVYEEVLEELSRRKVELEAKDGPEPTDEGT